jgi:hypothetical protein
VTRDAVEKPVRTSRCDFSIAHMMLFVVVLALGLAPLGAPLGLMTGVNAYLRVGIVVAATFAARYRTGRASAWWFGFAVFGWASLLFDIEGGVFEYQSTEWCRAFGVHPLQLTTDLTEMLHDMFKRKPDPMGYTLEDWAATIKFVKLLVVGSAGGFMSRALQRLTRDR